MHHKYWKMITAAEGQSDIKGKSLSRLFLPVQNSDYTPANQQHRGKALA